MPETHDKPKQPRTEAQKEAARINGSKSHGPITPDGKAKSSRNALRHGLTASDLALSNEDAEAFNNVLADYTAEYLSEGPTKTNLVEQIAFASGVSTAPGPPKPPSTTSKWTSTMNA